MVVWGFGVGVLYWVLGLGPVVWGLLVFLGWGSLYEHKKINLEKNGTYVIANEEYVIA